VPCASADCVAWLSALGSSVHSVADAVAVTDDTAAPAKGASAVIVPRLLMARLYVQLLTTGSRCYFDGDLVMQLHSVARDVVILSYINLLTSFQLLYNWTVCSSWH
jgi:hypothetical protein